MSGVPDQLLTTVWLSALAPAMLLLPQQMSTARAWHMLLAAGLQETQLKARVQVLDGGGRGAARGLLQFERGGGVRGVLTHPQTKAPAASVCAARGVQPIAQDVWERMEFDDVLCFAFGRLLLWADPLPLPGPDDVEAAWDLYANRTWNPGKPHRQAWGPNHARARRFVYGE